MAKLVPVDEQPKKGPRLVPVDDPSSFERQIKLTGRHALEGVGGALDFVTSPFRVPQEIITGDQISYEQMGGDLATRIGLPTPSTPTERIAGKAANLAAGGGGLVGGARAASRALTGAGKAAAEILGSRAGLQTAANVGAGAGGEAVKEQGSAPHWQFAGALAGGLVAPGVLGGLSRLSRAVMPKKTDLTLTVQIDTKIENAVKSLGIPLSDVPMHIRNQLRQDVAAAMSIGELSPDAIRRLADYRLTGATPTRAGLTLDPIDVTRQKNLAKVGANSTDENMQALARIESGNAKALASRLDDLGANTSVDQHAAGQQVIGALAARDRSAKAAIGERYSAARASDGRSAQLDPSFFTNRASNLLDEALLGGKIDADVRGLLNRVATGEMPLTVDVAEQIKTRIGDLQRGSTEPSVRKALGLVRQALEETPLVDGSGQGAIDAFNRARRANRAYMGQVERTPALQAVRDGVEPDRFIKDFILGKSGKADVSDVQALARIARKSPETMATIRDQISKHLSGVADPGGQKTQFNQSSYNKALEAIGDRKLALFFSPEEVAQLKAVGRVGFYESTQPRGAAVNNSNSGALVAATALEWLGKLPFVRAIPFGESAVSQPALGFAHRIQSRHATNIPYGLLAQRKAPPIPGAPLLLPAGLLTSD